MSNSLNSHLAQSPSGFDAGEHAMRLALQEAEKALKHEDVPVGAVVLLDGEVLARGKNERELLGDPTAHAEIGSLYNLGADPRLTHNFEVEGGVLEQECAELLQRFFAGKRLPADNNVRPLG